MATNEKNETAIRKAKELKNIPWCDEYERMISSMPFRPWENEIIIEAQARSRKLVDQFNSLRTFVDTPEEGASKTDAERERILSLLLGAFSDTPNIEPPFAVLYGCNLRIGKEFFANCNLAIDDSGMVTIGDNVVIGPDVHFITLNHPTNVAERLKKVMYARPIEVGNACWIGARATILPGVTIGQGSTIGAGAVVSRDIPPNSVAVGNPARVVKELLP